MIRHNWECFVILYATYYLYYLYVTVYLIQNYLLNKKNLKFIFCQKSIKVLKKNFLFLHPKKIFFSKSSLLLTLIN